MATDPQIHANRRNAQFSTGPQTDLGRSTSSKNAQTKGLFTQQDYVKPDEKEIYKYFCQSYYTDLAPLGITEETLTAEITSAAWRLRRCQSCEADLADYREKDPLLIESTDKDRRSIERARSSARASYHRGLRELRILQNERASRLTLGLANIPKDSPYLPPLADSQNLQKLADQQVRNGRAQQQMEKQQQIIEQPKSESWEIALERQLDAIMNAPEPDWSAIMNMPTPAESVPDVNLASICKTASTPANGRSGAQEFISQYLPCACGSGQINRRCCGPTPRKAA